MTKKLFCIAVIASLLTTACNKKEDFFDPNAVKAEEDAESLMNAEKVLGTNIDANHEWVLTTTYSVSIEKKPSDIKTENIFIFDANPLKDNSASILAYSKNANNIIFEAPKGLHSFFAACIDAEGDVRVAEFMSNESSVSFESKKPYTVESKTQQNNAKSLMSRNRIKKAEDLVWQKTLNAKTFPDSGWNDEWTYVERGEQNAHFTNVNNYIDEVHAFLPEQGLNYRDKLNNNEMVRNNYYAVVGAGGGEVSVTPIYRETSSNPTRFGYYYFLPNEDRNVKTVHKYIFEEEIPFNYFHVTEIPDEQTLPIYRLIYYDEEGIPSYTFPEGTQIGFFNVHKSEYNLDGDLIWYNIIDANIDLSKYLADRNVLPDWAKSYNVDWYNYSHTIMFERGGVKYITFEDWVKDFDMNDIVLMLEGNVEELPVAPTKSCKEDIKYYRYSYGFEDTRNGDYDMNDVVLRVWRPSLNANYLNVELAAVGAADQVYAFFTNQNGEKIPLFDGKEVHQLFEELGYHETYYNTPEINAPNLPLTTVSITDWSTFIYARADFYIYNATKNLVVHLPAAIGQKGVAPYAVCMPQKEWKWPKERICIINAYDEFKAFAADQNVNVDWWKKPNEGKVLTLKSNH